MMRVIEFKPHTWFFLTDDKQFFIDVYCNHSFVGFSTLIALNDIETLEYQAKGRSYLNTLADDVQYFALTKYKQRNIKGIIATQVYDAIRLFNAS